MVSVESNIALATGAGGAARGDRAILRRWGLGIEDVFAVFERTAAEARWRLVTSELTADQLANWTAFRVPNGEVGSPDVDRWLTQIRDRRLTVASAAHRA